MKKVVKSYNIIITILITFAVIISIIPYANSKYYNIEMGLTGYQQTDIHNINSNILNSSAIGMIFFISMCILLVWMIIRIIFRKNAKFYLFSNSISFNFVCTVCSFLGILSSIFAFLQVSNKEYIDYFGKNFKYCNYHQIEYSNLGQPILISLLIICLGLVVYSFVGLIISSSKEK